MLTRRGFGLGGLGGLLSAGAASAQAESRFTAFFTGRVTGEGTARNLRSGATRSLKAVLAGRSTGGVFLLRQDVAFSDGERQSRQWRFQRSEDGFVGVAGDVIGSASLVFTREGARLAYKARTRVEGETHDLNFEETMRFIDGGRMTNHVGVAFWIIPVGELNLALHKRA